MCLWYTHKCFCLFLYFYILSLMILIMACNLMYVYYAFSIQYCYILSSSLYPSLHCLFRLSLCLSSTLPRSLSLSLCLSRFPSISLSLSFFPSYSLLPLFIHSVKHHLVESWFQLSILLQILSFLRSERQEKDVGTRFKRICRRLQFC